MTKSLFRIAVFLFLLATHDTFAQVPAVSLCNRQSVTKCAEVNENGDIEVTLKNSSGSSDIVSSSEAVDGSGLPTNVQVVGGTTGSVVETLHFDSSGQLQVTNGSDAVTSGGATPYKLVSAATNNATSLKASAGQIYSIQAVNINAAVRYLKLYNKASAPTCGTDVPVNVIAIPGGGGTTGGPVQISFPVGMEFTVGIAFCIVTGITDADNTATAASEQIVNIQYK